MVKQEGNVIVLRDEVENLRRMFPLKAGIRIRAKGEPSKRNARAATLWTYLESQSGGGHYYALHETVFARRGVQSSDEWKAYFAKKVFKGTGSNDDFPAKRLGVLEGAIVPGVNIKTRKYWSVRAVIGYNLHDNVRAVYTAIHTRRHKA